VLSFPIERRRRQLEHSDRSAVAGSPDPRGNLFVVHDRVRPLRIWDAVRREVDTRGIPGQFLLTGSATPKDDSTRHSGAGRMLMVTMRPVAYRRDDGVSESHYQPAVRALSRHCQMQQIGTERSSEETHDSPPQPPARPALEHRSQRPMAGGGTIRSPRSRSPQAARVP